MKQTQELRRLEPYTGKLVRTVLRRGGAIRNLPKCSFLSDYLISKEEVLEQSGNAELFYQAVSGYLKQKIPVCEEK